MIVRIWHGWTAPATRTNTRRCLKMKSSSKAQENKKGQAELPSGVAWGVGRDG